VGASNQGQSIALSADGNTAIVGGYLDEGGAGAAWVYIRSGSVWMQQGSKLFGAAAAGAANQGYSVALAADGNTAIVGGHGDNGGAGAVWVFTRSGGVWTPQGSKLIATGTAGLGASVAVSADGNTAIFGADLDNGGVGAAFVFTRSGSVWTQQGGKLVGSSAVGPAAQGFSVALSADGNTAIVGGDFDNNFVTGAAWIFTRSGGAWSQQGPKLVGNGGVGTPNQGKGVALSADGTIAIVGGNGDNDGAGATWVWTASGGVWTQQGAKLVGSGAAGPAHQGSSVALSGDGNTAIVGGFTDGSNSGPNIGAAWVFARQSAPLLQVTPAINISASGPHGGPFTPTSFDYQISAANGNVAYSISGIPTWLNASFISGTATASPVTVTFSLMNVGTLAAGTYSAVISFTNTTNGQGSTSRTATLTVLPGKDDCKDGGWQNFPAPPGPFKNQGQ
jgi:FG-GAP repeat protein